MSTQPRTTGQNKRTGRCKFCQTTFRSGKMFNRRKFCSNNCRVKAHYKKLKEAFDKYGET